MLRLPITLWLHALADLWRVVLLSTVVLVVVISFAATVRYTAAGKLGPLETLTFMFYAIPPMLQYALPFAAGFGATLAYHRMTQDNEMTAAAASGVSHRALLAPAVISGIVIGGVLWVLAGQVIPRFLKHMELMITEDAKKILIASIQAGRPVEFSGKMIHARAVYPLDGDKEGKPDRLVLADVSALELDKDGAVVSESFAKRAWLTFYPAPEGPDQEDQARSSRTIISMTMEKGRVYKPDSGIVEADTGTYALPVIGSFSNDPKFLTTGELADLPNHPDRHTAVDVQRRKVVEILGERRSIQVIDTSLRKEHRIRLEDSEGRSYTIHAGGVERRAERWELLPPGPGKDIEVERFNAGRSGEGTRFTPRSAGLVTTHDGTPGDVNLTLVMETVAGQAIGAARSVDPAGAPGIGTERKCPGLKLTDSTVKDLQRMTSPQILAEVQRTGLMDDPQVGPAAKYLDECVENLKRNVISKQHERVADSVACLVMIVCGAVTSLRLGNSMPLTVYLWSFFPALLTVITISSGQQTTRHLGLQGLAVLWGGVALLAAYAAGAYWIVKRH